MWKALAKGINFMFGRTLYKRKIIISESLTYLARERVIDRNYFDKVRLATLELLSYEIERKGLIGNVAELGVYKGKFARYINSYFATRLLYLFDTFEGFDERDISKEKQNDFSSGDQNFAETSVEKVLALMPHRDKCIPVKGFFPESARAVDDQFVLVSLDADLYEPIYHGLNFFYPRMVQGGYILIHDVNNDLYKGARRAVEVFCTERGIAFVPLPDGGGTAIVAK